MKYPKMDYKPPAPVREKVRRMYYEQGLTVREIALLLGTSKANIYEHLGKIRAKGEETA